MYKEKRELIKSINYYTDPETTGCFYGTDNLLYRSLYNLFETFWVRTKPSRELYLVGGCVRDMLLGKEPKDYDLCTNAAPDEVKQICDAIGLRYFDSGIKHGTLTIIDDFYHQQYEITTYRIDGKYSDGRHPDEVIFTSSLEEDLKRRDFTINSFAYNLLTSEVLVLDESYFKDLEFGIIRAVGYPAERYEEDALRMLRAIRFAAQLGFSIEEYTYKALLIDAPLLKNISKERIRDELTKILLSDNPQMIEFIVTTGMELYMFDGDTPITAMLNCEHQNPWHYTDVFHHTMDVVKGVPKTFELRWAALFHDVGKPLVKALKPGSTDHYRYIGHPEESVKIADKLMDLLKFSNKQKEIIHNYVLYHDYPFATCNDKKFKRKVVEIGEDNFKDFIQLIQADGLAHKLSMSTQFAVDGLSDIKIRFYGLLENKDPLRIKDLEINGDEIKELGLEGKQIGDCLEYLLDKVLSKPELNEKRKLKGLVEKYKKEELPFYE